LSASFIHSCDLQQCAWQNLIFRMSIVDVGYFELARIRTPSCAVLYIRYLIHALFYTCLSYTCDAATREQVYSWYWCCRLLDDTGCLPCFMHIRQKPIARANAMCKGSGRLGTVSPEVPRVSLKCDTRVSSDLDIVVISPQQPKLLTDSPASLRSQ
jgi:hypothetical protein